jgi:hypothetical protein
MQILRNLALLALLSASALAAPQSPSQAQQPPRQLKGVLFKENPELLAKWGEGYHFESNFENVLVRASSAFRVSDGTNAGSPKVHDFKLNTAWVANSKGPGEYLEYTLSSTPGDHPGAAITSLTVVNGYRGEDWKVYGRVRRMKMSVNGKPYGTITLTDTQNIQVVELGSIPLPARGKTLVFRFTIEDTYPGTEYPNPAITELEIGGSAVAS